jgi:hypothetical protein
MSSLDINIPSSPQIHYKIDDFFYTQSTCISSLNTVECKNNKTLADEMSNSQIINSGGNKRFLDISVEYNYELMRTINLCGGNLFLLLLIIYNLM